MSIILIGGSPCSGKSSVSEYLSKKYHYQHIRIDDYMGKHIEESDPIKHPIMNKWKTNPWHELFSQDVKHQFNEELLFYEEEWPLILRDITNEITSEHVVIEGCGLLPSKIKDLGSNLKIIYMVPTEEFQKEKYQKRLWAHELVKDAKDPKQAFLNWMNRDVMFSKHIQKEAEVLGFEVLITDGKNTITEVAEYIKNKPV